MNRRIFITLIMCLGGCAHVKRDWQQAEVPSASRQLFCSETPGNRLHLRLTIDLMSSDLKERTLHKQFEIPYFERKDGALDLQISREILDWRKDRIVLAEVAPTETINLFMLYVTSFERSKGVKLTSNANILLRLCQDAEMSISGDEKLHSLKARLELVGDTNKKVP